MNKFIIFCLDNQYCGFFFAILPQKKNNRNYEEICFDSIGVDNHCVCVVLQQAWLQVGTLPTFQFCNTISPQPQWK